MKIILTYLLVFCIAESVAQWTIQPTATSNIYFSDQEYIGDSEIILSFGSAICKYNMATNELDTLVYDLSKAFQEISFINDSVGYILSVPSDLYKTTDRGNTWNLVTNNLVNGYPSTDLLFLNDSIGYFTAANGGALTKKTLDGGQTWITLSDSTLQYSPQLGGASLCWHSANNMICQVAGRVFSFSLDGGISWQENIMQSFSGSYNRIRSNGNVLVATASSHNGSFNTGLIAVSTDNGTTWSVTEIEVASGFYDVSIINDSTFVIVGRLQSGGYYTIYKTTNGGITWGGQVYAPLPSYYFGLLNITCISEDSCLASGYDNLIATTTNGGGAVLSTGKEKKFLPKVKIYPNPSRGNFQIESDVAVESIEVLDIQGKQVTTSSFINTNTITINLSNQPNGMYWMQLQTASGVVHKKLVKTH